MIANAIKLVIALLGGTTLIQLGINFMIDTYSYVAKNGNSLGVFEAVIYAVGRLPRNFSKTVVVQLMKSIPRLVLFIFRLIPKLVLIILDIPIALVWALIPGLDSICAAPKLSKIL